MFRFQQSCSVTSGFSGLLGSKTNTDLSIHEFLMAYWSPLEGECGVSPKGSCVGSLVPKEVVGLLRSEVWGDVEMAQSVLGIIIHPYCYQCEGKDSRIPEACWTVSLAKWVNSRFTESSYFIK